MVVIIILFLFSRVQQPETEKNEFEDLTLSDLEVVTTLGVGGFGRVDLVRIQFFFSIYPHNYIKNDITN